MRTAPMPDELKSKLDYVDSPFDTAKLRRMLIDEPRGRGAPTSHDPLAVDFLEHSWPIGFEGERGAKHIIRWRNHKVSSMAAIDPTTGGERGQELAPTHANAVAHPRT